jgi:hypothetical protein
MTHGKWCYSMRPIVSGKTLTELYSYLQGNGGSYNDLRICFRNSGIEPSKNVTYTSTRNKDRFLDEYIQLLRLEDIEDAERLMRFIEQVVDFTNPQSQRLLECLQQDGWQIVGNRIVLVEHSVDALIASMFRGQPIDTIQREWDRAKLSVVNDPADALTAASSMIEATYKFILHAMGHPFPSSQKMRGLSKTVHPLLHISPDQEADEDFRALFQGIISVAQSVSSLRTKIGDAHGASPTRGQPLARHARLAVNVAGAVCIFLLETYQGMNAQASTAQA